MPSSASLSPEEFERSVAEFLVGAGDGLTSFRVLHREHLSGPDGTYEVDVTARFEALGASFLVLVECKHQRRPVERDVVQVLRDRLSAVAAQKGILFSTSPFQSGAVQYAARHGIALVFVEDTRFTYIEIRAGQAAPPLRDGDPPYTHWLATVDAPPSDETALEGVTYSNLASLGLSPLLESLTSLPGV